MTRNRFTFEDGHWIQWKIIYRSWTTKWDLTGWVNIINRANAPVQNCIHISLDFRYSHTPSLCSIGTTIIHISQSPSLSIFDMANHGWWRSITSVYLQEYAATEAVASVSVFSSIPGHWSSLFPLFSIWIRTCSHPHWPHSYHRNRNHGEIAGGPTVICGMDITLVLRLSPEF